MRFVEAMSSFGGSRWLVVGDDRVESVGWEREEGTTNETSRTNVTSCEPSSCKKRVRHGQLPGAS